MLTFMSIDGEKRRSALPLVLRVRAATGRNRRRSCRGGGEGRGCRRCRFAFHGEEDEAGCKFDGFGVHGLGLMGAGEEV